jgi:hypothetical protein
LYLFKNKIIYKFCEIYGYKEIEKKTITFVVVVGSRIRDGKKSGSGINISRIRNTASM